MNKYIALTMIALTSTEAVTLRHITRGRVAKDALLAQIEAHEKAMSTPAISLEDCEILISSVDDNDNGVFDYDEFQAVVEAEGLDEEAAEEVWDLCDADDSDGITAEELFDCLNAMLEG